MRTIELSQGKVAMVDDEDFERLNAFKWYFAKGYAKRSIYGDGKKRTWLLYWSVVGKPPKGMVVDHIDGDGLNNQKSNLRVCTQGQNLINQKMRSNNTSGYKGVMRSGAKWEAAIRANKKCRHLGTFPTKEEAYAAYCTASKELHGEYARPLHENLDLITKTNTE